jgi:hypothetical protein
MIKLKDILGGNVDSIKWIVGIVDNYGKIHHKVVQLNDPIDSHNQIWPLAHHGKWRWMPSKPTQINTYNEQVDEDAIDAIWQLIDRYRLFL